jgi:hypothetical protein
MEWLGRGFMREVFFTWLRHRATYRETTDSHVTCFATTTALAPAQAETEKPAAMPTNLICSSMNEGTSVAGSLHWLKFESSWEAKALEGRAPTLKLLRHNGGKNLVNRNRRCAGRRRTDSPLRRW